MKLFIEFKNKEIRDKYIEKLNTRGFENSINSFGTLLIKIETMNMNVLDNTLGIENDLRYTTIDVNDITYIEVQKEMA